MQKKKKKKVYHNLPFHLIEIQQHDNAAMQCHLERTCELGLLGKKNWGNFSGSTMDQTALPPPL